MKSKIATLLIGLVLVFGVPATPASQESTVGQAHFTPDQLATFAKEVERSAAARGAQVFLIARVGRASSELPPGVHYTHTAFAVYSEIRTDDGRVVPGYAIYNLYQRTDRPEVSDLVQDFPVDFFAGAHKLEAGVVIPTRDLQQRLLEVITSETYRNLHNPRYSVLANPYDVRYQNCTEHVLDVLNAAIYQIDDLTQIKANIRAYFVAQPIEVSPTKLLLGAVFRQDLALEDHSEQVETATFSTITEFLHRYGLVQDELVVMAP